MLIARLQTDLFLIKILITALFKSYPPAGGWRKVVDKFTEVHVPEMDKFQDRMIVLLIDFDDRQEIRLQYVKEKIPDKLKNRVFVLGVLSEPENLKRDVRMNFEEIGEALALDCSESTNNLWGNNLLQHNKTELERMILYVKSFLFNSK